MKKNYEPYIYFDLRTGYTCQNHCIHCFVEDKRKFATNLTTREIKTIIDGIEQDPFIIISFTGGEASIREDFVELLKYSISKNHKNALQTNGISFSDEKFLESVGPYLHSVLVAIHSHIPKVFEAITQKENSFNDAVLGFKNILKLGIHCKTQTVINRLNYTHLLDIFDFIQHIAPGTQMSITFPHMSGGADSTFVSPRYSEIKQFLPPVLKKWANLMNSHYIPICYLYPYQDEIFNESELDGKKFRPGIDNINNSWKLTNYGVLEKGSRVKAKECEECIFYDRCTGIWTNYLNLYGTLDVIPIKKL